MSVCSVECNYMGTYIVMKFDRRYTYTHTHVYTLSYIIFHLHIPNFKIWGFPLRFGEGSGQLPSAHV